MKDQLNKEKDFERIPVKDLLRSLTAILVKNGFTIEKAHACANIFVQNSVDGSISHGINRFPRFINYIKNNHVNVHAEPECTKSAGCIEQWNGHLGPGPLNALFCTNRAMEIAVSQGIGCIGLANTNHWMRGGYYANIAAAKGFIFIGWTNTIANMPAWGATDRRVGNNPLVIGVPYEPVPLVLDMAMSQFSYGTMETKSLRGEKLFVPGGYSNQNELTNDPSEILSSGRPLSIGYWKGSGLALFLDILATIISGGSSTHEITLRDAEYGISQVFIAVHVSSMNTNNAVFEIVRSIIDDVKQSIPSDPNISVRYPSENMIHTREYNIENGIPVDHSIWKEIQQM